MTKEKKEHKDKQFSNRNVCKNKLLINFANKKINKTIKNSVIFFLSLLI